jgi:hypothetical protein
VTAPVDDHEHIQRIVRREEILPKIAELAQISETNRPAFYLRMYATIWGAWKLHEQRQKGKEIPSKEALIRVAETMRAVIDALDDLDGGERAQITQILKRMRSQREKSLKSLRDMVSDQSEITAELVAEREEQELKAYDVLLSQPQWGWFDIIRNAAVALSLGDGEHQPARRGRPRGAVTDPGFHRVVRGLLSAAANGGGRLTLTRKSSSGTLLRSIDLLRPCLPLGFLPNVLPLGTIEDIKNDSKNKSRNN